MEDYTSNSKKSKETEERPEKNVEKVVVGEVTVQKKGLGRKFKDIFVAADLKGAINYVAGDVLVPAARDMIVDAASKGVERMMYGETSRSRRSMYGGRTGSRVTYNNPINRGYREPVSSRRPAMEARTPRRGQDEFILASREEADLVLERLGDIIDNYEVASVADLNELVGMPSTHVDNKWGWVYIGDSRVRQTREGYLLDLPPAEPIK